MSEESQGEASEDKDDGSGEDNDDHSSHGQVSVLFQFLFFFWIHLLFFAIALYRAMSLPH